MEAKYLLIICLSSVYMYGEVLIGFLIGLGWILKLQMLSSCRFWMAKYFLIICLIFAHMDGDALTYGLMEWKVVGSMVDQ